MQVLSPMRQIRDISLSADLPRPGNTGISMRPRPGVLGICGPGYRSCPGVLSAEGPHEPNEYSPRAPFPPLRLASLFPSLFRAHGRAHLIAPRLRSSSEIGNRSSSFARSREGLDSGR